MNTDNDFNMSPCTEHRKKRKPVYSKLTIIYNESVRANVEAVNN